MYQWLALFVVGWFGTYWWPGQAAGAPNPKDPHPWERLAIGVLAGIAAVVIVPKTGNSEPMPGLILGIAVGCVIGKFADSLMVGMRNRGQ